MRLYVGGLPHQTTETDLIDLFSQQGQVTEAIVITDRETGRSKGFGFIQMSDEQEAQSAIARLNGTAMADRTIMVNQAREQDLATLHPFEMQDWQAQVVALEAHADATNLIAQALPATKEHANQSAARYLPDRLIVDQEAVLALMPRLVVPFDNNQAERDVVRVVKVQQKIPNSLPLPKVTETPIPSLLNTPTNGVMATQSDKVPTLYLRLLRLFKKRFWGFGLVGLGVMFGGMILMYVLVKLCGVEQNIAYFVQAVASIEASFLLNRFINWRDRSGKLYNQWIKFHTTKIGTVILNQLLFGILVARGFHYLLATLIGVGVATIINYVTNDRLVFAPRKWEGMPTQRLRSYRLDLMPKVGVVIPVRNSHRTIRQCVESALEQDYRGEFTIFIVGNSHEQDTTWETLGDLTQHFRVKCLYISRPNHWVGRDANMKRYFGCIAATNAGFDVIAFLDSQVMAPPNWLSSAVQQMYEKRVDGVAGISCRNPKDNSMSGIYQDGSLFSEWPRYGLEYFLSKETFGQAKGLPITANMLISKQVFERVNTRWPVNAPYGWEDFQLAWCMACEGFTILCTDTLCVYRNHKRKFRLIKHFSSGMGAIDFYRHRPDCGYTKRMMIKAVFASIILGLMLPLSMVLSILGGFTTLAWLGIALGIGVTLICTMSVLKARNWRGIFFFPLDVIHISLWIAGAFYLLSKRGKINTALADLLVKTR